MKVKLRNPKIGERKDGTFSLRINVECEGKRGTVEVSSISLGLQKMTNPSQGPKEVLMDALKFEVTQWLIFQGLKKVVSKRAKDAIIGWVRELKEIEV